MRPVSVVEDLEEPEDSVDLILVQHEQLRRYAQDLANTYQQLRETQSKLEGLYLSTLTALASAIEARDSYLVGHSKAVEAYALGVGRQMGLSVPMLETLRRAALLHDIGKIGVPDSTLKKPGPLEEPEWQAMRCHPEVGYQILSKLQFLGEALLGVRHHHERYDGEGYPAGLAGTKIPMVARILSACDALDAMLSSRPYRSGISKERALEVLHQDSGSQFDPQVVDALAKSIGG